MIRTVIIPDNRKHWLSLRRPILTSTDVSTLFGYNPYQSLSRLWNIKKGLISDERPLNPKMQYGLDNEDRVAAEIAREQKYQMADFKEFIQIPSLRLGSSYDKRILTPQGWIPFEIKCVCEQAFYKAWIRYGKELVYAGPRVELQLQVQMLVGDFAMNRIGAEVSNKAKDHLVGYRKANPLEWRMIVDKVGVFWKAFDADMPLPGVRVARKKKVA